MATLSQTALGVDKPRILHGPISSEAFAYPSQGGFVRKHITRAEFDWLCLHPPSDSAGHQAAENKTEAKQDANDEDALALRMVQLGGHWWPSQKLYECHSSQDISYGYHYPPDVDIGYRATGGVLVLHTWAGNSPYLDGLPGVPTEKPDTWSRLSFCASMEEHCDVLREFGAVVYESVQACPDVPKFLEEGIAIGREYERLLKKMEDRSYVDRWLDTL